MQQKLDIDDMQFLYLSQPAEFLVHVSLTCISILWCKQNTNRKNPTSCFQLCSIVHSPLSVRPASRKKRSDHCHHLPCQQGNQCPQTACSERYGGEAWVPWRQATRGSRSCDRSEGSSEDWASSPGWSLGPSGPAAEGTACAPGRRETVSGLVFTSHVTGHMTVLNYFGALDRF